MVVALLLMLLPETPGEEVRLLIFDPFSFLYPGIGLFDSGKGG